MPKKSVQRKPALFSNPFFQVFAGIAIFLVTIELFLQVTVPDNPFRVSNAQTNVQGADSNYLVKTTSKGIRAMHEYSEQPDSNTFRIAVVGDSYVFGANVDTNETVTAFLENDFQTLSCKKLEFLNFGWPGVGPKKYKVAMEFSEQNYHPNAYLVVVYLGNDFLNSFEDNQFSLKQIVKHCRICMAAYALWIENQQRNTINPSAQDIATNLYFNSQNNPELFKKGLLFADEKTRQQSIAAFEKDILALRDFATEKQKPIFFVAVPSPLQVSRDYFSFFEQIGFLMDEQFLYDWRVQQAFESVCSKNTLKCLDFSAFFRDSGIADTIYWKRDDHLKSEGNRFLVQLISNHVVPALAPVCG